MRTLSSSAVAGKPLPQFVKDLLSAPPHAGEGVHSWLFRVARVLHPYRSEAEIEAILEASVVTCGRVVTAKEIRDAIQNSKSAAWQPGSNASAPAKAMPTPPRWPSLNQEQRDSVIQTGVSLVDLWEMSPHRLEDNDGHSEWFIDQLFPGNPFLCCGVSSRSFDTRTREEWRGKLSQLQLIVPSPMIARRGMTKDGKESAHTLANTGPRRFLVVEFDSGTVDEQAALLVHLAGIAPLALAVHSGSRSLHGWFYCVGQSEQTLRGFMSCAVSLGADRATWTKSQFVRLPDGLRDNGKRQSVYFFNPEVLL